MSAAFGPPQRGPNRPFWPLGLALALGLALLSVPALLGAYVTVDSSKILVLADDGSQDNTGYWATVLEPPYPGGQNLLYGPDALTFTGTSHLVFDLNGTAVDMQTSEPPAVPVAAASGPGPDGLGDSISMARSLGSLEYGATYTIVVNPHTGAGADTVQIQAWVSDSPAGLPAAVGLRILEDTMVGGNDGSPLSTDDGVSVYGANTLDQAVTEGVPSDWWSYNQWPSPTLTAQGVLWGNQYGAAATPPDAVEFCQWTDVYAMGFWETDPYPGVLFSTYETSEQPDGDTAVALWYTNTGQAGYVDGNGSAQGDGYTVQPGQTLVFTTYVGLSQSVFGGSPTPTPSLTPTLSPSFTASPTRSPSFTVSPSLTVSPTVSPSFSASPSFTASPSFSASPTATPTATISPTFTVSPTYTVSPTVTQSFTVSPTFTASPSPSVSPTASPTATASPSDTVTPGLAATATATPEESPTPAGYLVLTAKYPNPDPTRGAVWIPYVLTCDADVNMRIYDVAGETVRDLAPFDGQTGPNEEEWDGLNSYGRPAASGVYIVHITAQALGETRDAWVKLAIAR